MKLGCHVSNNGITMLEGAAKTAVSYNANCFMVYMGAPQNTFRKPITSMNIKEMHQVLMINDISLNDVIVHAPYIVNLGQIDDNKFNYAIDFLTNEVLLVHEAGLKIMVLHPGAHVGAGFEYAVERIASGIRQILKRTNHTDVLIALETMAGKGTEVGRTFEQIQRIIELVDSPRIGVCLDTCHIHDAGYDIVNCYDEVIKEFDQVIGLENLKVLHVNDSKNLCGTHKDRHENFGFGCIGFDTLMKFINDERFKDIPKILETPYIESPTIKDRSYEPYYFEIEMIKSQTFDPFLKERIIKDNE